MYWSSFGAWLGRLFDDRITIDDVIGYAIIGAAIIGIVAASIEYIGGRVREDQPRKQRFRAWQRRRRSKALEDRR